MWQMRKSTIPVVVGALGFVGKDSNRIIDGISSRPCLKEIQNLFLQKQLAHYEDLYLCKICVILIFLDKNDQ